MEQFSRTSSTLTIAALCCFVLVRVQPLSGQAQSNTGASGHLYEGPGVLPSQILRARGFIVEEHVVITKDNYTIRLTRALNPLINKGQHGLQNRIPIIFIHGILESYNVFVVNSFGAEPKNFSNCTLADLSLSDARRGLANEPSAKSMPILALQYGHEIWLVSRRGFPGSQKQEGNPIQGDDGSRGVLPANGPISAFVGGITNYGLLANQVRFSVDKRFWNFSCDEQVYYDMPAIVDYVLNESEYEQVSIVGHSAGGAITLMALSEFPELNQKINSVIYWAQAFGVGRGTQNKEALAAIQEILAKFIGAAPPTYTTTQLQALFTLFCTPKITQTVLCETLSDIILGSSGGQAPMRPEFLNSLLFSSSSHELSQIFYPLYRSGFLRHYNYGPEGNLAAYGQLEEPPYNLSKITLKRMSFYTGATDGLVTPADNVATVRLLKVPYNFHLIRAPFNHNGYFYQEENQLLAVIPSLREIQLFSERGAIGQVRNDKRRSGLRRNQKAKVSEKRRPKTEL